jgi:hypothetical protein
MAIEFENPLTAGTVLVREAIQSQNYNPGSAGWIVEADGDAEFNDVTIRGGTVVSGTSLYYNGAPAAGNLTLSLASTAGVDPFGNTYPAGYAWHNGADVIYAQDTSGNVTVGSTAANSALINPADGEHIIQANDADGDLAFNLNANTGAITLLQNGLNTYVLLPTSLNNNSTSGGIAFGSISAAGQEPTTTQVANSARVGLNNAGVGLNLLSPAPATTGNRALVQLAPAASGFTPLVQVRTPGSTSCDLSVTGSVTGGNMRWGSNQTPSPGGAPGQTWVSVVFNTPMPATPRVVCTPDSSSADLNASNIRWATTDESTTGFTINCWRDTNAATNFNWIAISD